MEEKPLGGRLELQRPPPLPLLDQEGKDQIFLFICLWKLLYVGLKLEMNSFYSKVHDF